MKVLTLCGKNNPPGNERNAAEIALKRFRGTKKLFISAGVLNKKSALISALFRGLTCEEGGSVLSGLRAAAQYRAWLSEEMQVVVTPRWSPLLLHYLLNTHW